MKIKLTESQFKRVILKENLVKRPDCNKLNSRILRKSAASSLINKMYQSQFPETKVKSTSLVRPNAYDIQEFLIELGYDIGNTGKFKNGVDGDFGDKTATAIGSFLYGKGSNIKTVDSLYKRLKSDNYDVGDTTGFGPKMANTISNILSDWVINSASKWCKNKNKRITYQMCLKNKNKISDELKDVWLDWANSLTTFEKLNKQNTTRVISPVELDLNRFKIEINRFSGNKIHCRYERDDSYLKKEKPVAYHSGGDIVMNCDSNMLKTYEDFRNVINHEFTHYLEHKVKGINQTDYWEKSLNLVDKGKWAQLRNMIDKFLREKKSISDILIDKEVLGNFKSIGVDEKDLMFWLRSIKGIKGNEEYICDKGEKESNLKTIKLHYCDNLYCDLSTNHIKEMIKIYKSNLPFSVKGNIEHLITCWALNGFKPSPQKFLNGLNDLALVDGANDNIT